MSTCDSVWPGLERDGNKHEFLAEFNGGCNKAKTATLLLLDLSKSKTLWQVFSLIFENVHQWIFPSKI